MKKRTFVIFGLVLAGMAILVPLWAILREGASSASPEQVPAGLTQGKELFATNCGTCHTLARAGADGTFGPNLDVLLAGAPASANKQRVLNAINKGIDSPTPGRMPAGILGGDQAEQVADFVSQEAGK